MISTNIKTLTLRGISLFVAVAFTATMLIGSPSEALAVSEIVGQAGGLKAQAELRKNLYAMPAELGSLVSLWEPPAGNAQNGFVVQIQDAHANPEGQQNVASMLKYLETKTPGLVIGLEGAAGELHPEYLNLVKGFPEANRAVIADLHQKGELNGAELFLLQKSQKRPETRDQRPQTRGVEASATVSGLQSAVFGVEDPALYRDNLETFRDLLFHRDEVQTLLNPILAQLEKESSQKLNGELRAFLKERSRRKDGRFSVQTFEHSDPDFQAYTRYLRQQALKLLEIDLKDPIEQLRFPNLLRVVMIEETRKGFDLEKARRQWEEAVRSLRAAAKDPGEKEFMEAFNTFGREKGFITEANTAAFSYPMDRALYPRKLIEGLFRFAKKHQLSFDGKDAFWKTWKLAVFQAEIDVTELMREMDMLEGQMIEKLARSEDEKALVRKLGDFDLLEKLLRLELSRSEYDKVLLERNTIENLFQGPETGDQRLATKSEGPKSQVPSLKSYYAAALHFYEVSLRRDEALVANLLSLSVRRTPYSVPAVSVFYSGGFHSPGVEAILREKGIGYAVFSPRITKIDHGEMYQKVMAGDNADLSAYFKVKNPFATKQAAIFFKEMLEVAAPALFEKYQMKPEDIAGHIEDVVRTHPVLSEAVAAELVGSKESASLRFQPKSGRDAVVSQNSAVMPPATLSNVLFVRSLEAPKTSTMIAASNTATTATVTLGTAQALTMTIRSSDFVPQAPSAQVSTRSEVREGAENSGSPTYREFKLNEPVVLELNAPGNRGYYEFFWKEKRHFLIAEILDGKPNIEFQDAWGETERTVDLLPNDELTIEDVRHSVFVDLRARTIKLTPQSRSEVRSAEFDTQLARVQALKGLSSDQSLMFNSMGRSIASFGGMVYALTEVPDLSATGLDQYRQQFYRNLDRSEREKGDLAERVLALMLTSGESLSRKALAVQKMLARDFPDPKSFEKMDLKVLRPWKKNEGPNRDRNIIETRAKFITEWLPGGTQAIERLKNQRAVYGKKASTLGDEILRLVVLQEFWETFYRASFDEGAKIPAWNDFQFQSLTHNEFLERVSRYFTHDADLDSYAGESYAGSFEAMIAMVYWANGDLQGEGLQSARKFIFSNFYQYVKSLYDLKTASEKSLQVIGHAAKEFHLDQALPLALPGSTRSEMRMFEAKKAADVLKALEDLTNFMHPGSVQLMDFADDEGLTDMQKIENLLIKGKLRGADGARAEAVKRLTEWINHPDGRVEIKKTGFFQFGTFIKELGEIGLLDHEAIVSLMDAFVLKEHLSTADFEKLFSQLVKGGFLKIREKEIFLIQSLFNDKTDMKTIKAALGEGKYKRLDEARPAVVKKLMEWIEHPDKHVMIREAGFLQFGILIKELGEIGFLDHEAIVSLMDAFVRYDRLAIKGLGEIFDQLVASGFMEESEKEFFLIRALFNDPSMELGEIARRIEQSQLLIPAQRKDLNAILIRRQPLKMWLASRMLPPPGFIGPFQRSEMRAKEYRLDAVKGAERPSKTAIGIPLFQADTSAEISLPPIKRKDLERELNGFSKFVKDIEHNINGFFDSAPNAKVVQKKLNSVVTHRMSVIARNLIAGQNELVANPYSAYMDSLNRWVEGLEHDPATTAEDKAILPYARILMDHIKRMYAFELTPLVADDEAPVEVKTAEAERQYQRAVEIIQQQLKRIKSLQDQELAKDTRAEQFSKNRVRFLAEFDQEIAAIKSVAASAKRELWPAEEKELEAIGQKKQVFQRALDEAKKRVSVKAQKRAAAIFAMQHDVLLYEIFEGWLIADGIKDVLVNNMVTENKSLVSQMFRLAMVEKYAMQLKYQFTLPAKLKVYDEKLAVDSLPAEAREQLQDQRNTLENQVAAFGDVVAFLDETATMIRRTEGEQRLTSPGASREGLILIIDKPISPSEYMRYKNDLGPALVGITAVVETDGSGGGVDLMSHLKIVTQADSNPPVLFAISGGAFRAMKVQMARDNETVTQFIISAQHDQLIVNPGPDMLEDYLREIRQQRLWKNALRRFLDNLGIDAAAEGFYANVVPGSQIGEILESAGANAVGLKRAELFVPEVTQAILHMVREIHQELELPAEGAGEESRSELRKVNISLEALSPLLSNAAVIGVASLIEAETRADMSASVLQGRTYRVRGYDFRKKDKNPEIYALLEAFRIVADPEIDAGFELYKNKFGALMLVLQLSAMIVAAAEQANRPGARPEFILPMVKSEADLEYVRTVILPIAEEYAKQRLLIQWETGIASAITAEETARKAVQEAVDRTRFGTMLETMESFQNLSKILALPYVRVLNVGLNDLEIAHIARELKRRAAGDDVEADRDDPWIQKIAGELDPGFVKLIIGMASGVEQHNAPIAAENRASVCFCGEIAADPKFAPFMIYLRNRFPHVTFSRSMSPEPLAENLFVAWNLKGVDMEHLQYFSSQTYQADSLAKRQGMAPIEELRRTMIAMEAYQERYEAQGLDTAFYSQDIDVLEGMGGIADFDFLKEMLKALLDPGKDEAILKRLDFNGKESLSTEELQRTVTYLVDERILVGREQNELLEAFMLVSQVQAVYREGHYPKKLFVGLMGDFLTKLMSSYEARFHSKPKWFSENLKQGPELDSAFENYYSRHTFNVHLIIKRIIHEQLARRFVPVMTDVRVLETLPDVIELVPPSRSETRAGVHYVPHIVGMQETGWAEIAERGWVYGPKNFLSLELVPRGESLGRNDVPEVERKQREAALFKYTQEHPWVLMRIALMSAEKSLRINHRTQMLIRQGAPAYSRTLRETRGKAVSPTSDRAMIEKDFGALLELDQNVAYALVRMKRLGLLDDLFWTDQDFLHVTMPTLRALGTMENLYESTDPVFYRVASVFKKIRSDPHAIKVFRLAAMMNAMIEAKPEKIWSDEEVLITVGDSLLSAGIRDPVTIKQVVDLVGTYRRISFETLHADEMAAKMMVANANVLNPIIAYFLPDEATALKDELKKPRVDNPSRNEQLYLLAFANRIAAVDYNQVAMLHRGGLKSPLASLDVFYLGLQALGGKIADEEAMRHVVDLAQKAVARGQKGALDNTPLYADSLDYRKALLAQLDQRAWDEIVKKYLSAVVPDDQAMQRQLKLEFENAGKLFRKDLENKLQNIFSGYYLRNLDPASYAKQIVLLKHLQLLKDKEDRETIPVVINRVPSRFQPIHEVLIGFPLDEPGLLKDFSRVLKENSFTIADADPHILPEGGFIARFVGTFSRNQDEIEKIQEKIALDLRTVFARPKVGLNMPAMSALTAVLRSSLGGVELRQRHLNELYGSTVILTRQEGIGKSTKVDFLTHEKSTDKSALVIEAEERKEPGLFLAIMTLLAEFKLDVKDFLFNNIVWTHPKMLLYVSKDGKAVAENDRPKIVARFKEVLDRPRIEIKKGLISKSPVRSELRLLAPVFAAGIMELAAGFSRPHRSEVRSIEPYRKDTTTYPDFAKAIFKLPDGLREELKGILKKADVLSALWRQAEIDQSVHEQLVRFFRQQRIPVPRELEDAGVTDSQEESYAAPLIEYVESALTRTKHKGLVPETHLSEENGFHGYGIFKGDIEGLITVRSGDDREEAVRKEAKREELKRIVTDPWSIWFRGHFETYQGMTEQAMAFFMREGIPMPIDLIVQDVHRFTNRNLPQTPFLDIVRDAMGFKPPWDRRLLELFFPGSRSRSELRLPAADSATEILKSERRSELQKVEEIFDRLKKTTLTDDQYSELEKKIESLVDDERAALYDFIVNNPSSSLNLAVAMDLFENKKIFEKINDLKTLMKGAQYPEPDRVVHAYALSRINKMIDANEILPQALAPYLPDLTSLYSSRDLFPAEQYQLARLLVLLGKGETLRRGQRASDFLVVIWRNDEHDMDWRLVQRIQDGREWLDDLLSMALWQKQNDNEHVMFAIATILSRYPEEEEKVFRDYLELNSVARLTPLEDFSEWVFQADYNKVAYLENYSPQDILNLIMSLPQYEHEFLLVASKWNGAYRFLIQRAEEENFSGLPLHTLSGLVLLHNHPHRAEGEARLNVVSEGDLSVMRLYQDLQGQPLAKGIVIDKSPADGKRVLAFYNTASGDYHEDQPIEGVRVINERTVGRQGIEDALRQAFGFAVPQPRSEVRGIKPDLRLETIDHSKNRSQARFSGTAEYKKVLARETVPGVELPVTAEIQNAIVQTAKRVSFSETGINFYVPQWTREQVRLWIAIQLVKAMGEREGRITNEPLRQFFDRFLKSLPENMRATVSGNEVSGPKFHINLSDMDEKEWSDFVSNFPVVLGVLVTLHASLSINVNAESKALDVIQKRFDALMEREGIVLAPDQLNIFPMTSRDHFPSHKPAEKADAFMARNKNDLLSRPQNVSSFWLTGDGGHMDVLAAGIATALLKVASDKGMDRYRTYEPSEFTTLLSTVLAAIQALQSLKQSA